ncbi:MAG: phosphoribosylamine--glycine ligase [Patescibacteria group bacterium]
MKKMKVLVIGSGGREHVLVQCISESSLAGEIFCAPGNAGTLERATNVAIKADDVPALLKFALEHEIDLTVVGPEKPLMDGIVDRFREAGLRIFGPTQAAAALEGSKLFAKQMMAATQVPTAAYQAFTRFDLAWEYARKVGVPLVIKADGLAGGKGAVVCHDMVHAREVLKQMLLHRVFGEAGDTVIIEEFLTGQEISVLAICDGESHRLLIPSQDHKALCEGDTGPNTGGMGAIAPVPWVDDAMLQTIDRTIITPILGGMAMEGNPFTGCLYAGLMITQDGPRVLEFNVRFGDPETQAILPLLDSDFLEMLFACVDGTLESYEIEWDAQFAVCVVLVSGGYPGKYRTGFVIKGLDEAARRQDVMICHAGTVNGFESGLPLTDGGRVANVIGLGLSLYEAIETAYAAVKGIEFTGMEFRSDIGAKAFATIK